MGRTIPSFRIALAMEKEDWKPFRKALVKRIEISLMKYLTFLNSIFQPALILFSMSDFTPF
jgi:hypothetical protein